MNTIELNSTLPLVFSQRTDIQSDIWRQDVTLERGHTYLIEANSGTGKSSLCSYIIGYRRDYSGSILFDGRDTRTLRVSEWVRTRMSHISYLFQELRLFPELTAMENVEIKNRLTSFKTRDEIRRWFEALGIADRMDTRVRFMSFGQQQRVAMIRALVQPFDFLLLDEPTSHLDDSNSEAMRDIMLQEANRQGAGIVVTSIGKHIQMNYDKTFLL